MLGRKSGWIILLTACLSLTVFAQQKPLQFFVSPLKMNVVYVGVKNPISITVPGVDPKDILSYVEEAESTLSIDSNGIFYLTANKPGKCTLIIVVRVNGIVHKIGEKELRVKTIPLPTPMVVHGQLKGGMVKADSLAQGNAIVAVLRDFDFEAREEIISYEMKYVSNGKLQTLTASSAAFTTEMKSVISQAQHNDVIIFDEIMVKAPDNKSYKLGQLAFIIK